MKSLDHLNSFLYKLWKLVNDENLSSIHWSGDGEKVVIEHPAEFTADVLNASDKKHFKTQNIASFIRQLNLYGFRRVKDNCGKIPLVFKHENFKQHRQDLLGMKVTLHLSKQSLPMPHKKGAIMEKRPTDLLDKHIEIFVRSFTYMTCCIAN